MKTWNIDTIEKITQAEAEALAEEKIIIKEHECFLIDFEGRFGYSILVFKNGNQVHYANDYELHHEYFIKESGRAALKEYYISKTSDKLFTDAELLEDIKTYDEYRRKSYFLHNYWIMRYNHISWFGKADDETRKKLETEYIYDCKVCFCYVADNSIIEAANRYFEHLENEFKKLQNDDEVFRKMIRYELANHEAQVSGEFDTTLLSLGMRFDTLSENKQKIVVDELRKMMYADEEE